MAIAYRLLLVDDEEEVRTSIMRKIDWEKTGFAVVGDAENGQDALEKIDLLEPDLVLTDIRMPYMDGLTLAKRIRQLRPSIKVIIFSGYDDFEYAKEAIKLNIIEYILKPVNAEELTEILLRIKNNLDDEVAQLRDVHALRESFVKNLPILRENFLNNLIRGCVKESQIPLLLKEYRLDLGNAEYWAVAQINIDHTASKNDENPLVQEEGLMPLSVKRLLDTHLASCCKFASFHRSSGLCAVVGMENLDQICQIITELNEVCRESRRILEQTLTIGIGQPCASLADIEKSYREAHEASGYHTIAGAGDVIYIADVEPENNSTLHLDSKAEADLVSVIKFGIRQNIINCVQEITGRMKNARLHESQYQAYIISVFNVLLQIVQRYELDEEEIFGQKADYYEILLAIRDADTLEKWLTETSLKISANLTCERQDNTKNMIRAAKKYIRENYSNSQLSLEMICTFLHISTTYFSTMFKREVGESYTTYLTRIRLEKAAEMLSITQEKTYIIAKEVGYDEPNYFGYVFKKKYGVSPNKYRGK